MANTGRVEKQQRDENPSSPTFGQTRWVDGGQDLTACPLPASFRSAAITENVTRDNCPSGQYGTAVPVTLAAGAYTSTVSQLDADAQARTAFNASKQTYANQYGSCTLNPGSSVVWVPVYQNDGCFACQMQNADDASDVRDATSQEAAQYQRATSNDGFACPSCTLQ